MQIRVERLAFAGRASQARPIEKSLTRRAGVYSSLISSSLVNPIWRKMSMSVPVASSLWSGTTVRKTLPSAIRDMGT